MCGEEKVGFARKQLEKHGWCEGKGLGKEESGISKAIKVNIKTDTAGVGYDAGDQFSFHWWDHVFNKTAKSIVVQENDEGVEVVRSSNVSCTVSNKRPNKNNSKPLLYGRFVKGSDQANDSVTQTSGEESDSKRDFSHVCPDEKLFRSCGGRTAHKAARHGFQMNGKLWRVEQQEKEGIAANSKPDDSDSDIKSCIPVETKQCKKKENRKKAKARKKDKYRKRKRNGVEEPGKTERTAQEENNSFKGDVSEKRAKKKRKQVK